MWKEELFNQLEAAADSDQAEKMAAYMKNNFTFLGIPKPKRKEIVSPYLKRNTDISIDWDFVRFCWEKPYREAQYVGLIYLSKHTKKLTEDDLSELKNLIVTKSWWDTVDEIDFSIGEIVRKNPTLEKTMLEWSTSDNIWLRRVAINYQLRYKEQTNTKILETVILNNLGSKEFFINKAIGWSLREYSKTDARWVRNFLQLHSEEMNKLSVREAKKYL